MSLKEKAKTVSICKAKGCIQDGRKFYTDETVISLEDARRELGLIETQFAEEVMKYKLKEEKEHGEIRFALAQTCTTLNDKIERLERERGELKQKLQRILDDFGSIDEYGNDDVIELHKNLLELLK